MAKQFRDNKDKSKGTYKEHSDGINNELGPKVNLPKRPRPYAGFSGTPIPKAPKTAGKTGLPIPKGPTVGGKTGTPIVKKPIVHQVPPAGILKGVNSDFDFNTLPKFAFKVNIGGFDGDVAFQTMDGLGSSIGKMEFRDGNSQKFYKQSRPTLTSFDPVTLKKGMFTGDTTLFDWYTNVSSGSMFSDMRDVTITLCDMRGNQLMDIFSWTLEKAYITKYTPTSLDGESDSDVAIEEIELTYQSFSTGASGGLLGALVGAVANLF
jgi:phage tail-like protein